MYYSVFNTYYGSGLICANQQGVIRVDIPAMNSDEKVDLTVPWGSSASDITVLTANKLEQFYAGENVDFSEVPVFFTKLTIFRQNILRRVRSVCYGNVCTYGQLAAACGVPNAARAVGGALAANPIPVIIPCHRVVASGGFLTGFSAAGGVMSKKNLLELEGVKFKGVRVDTNQLVMNNSLLGQKNIFEA